MLTESEMKHRIGLILGIEERADQADWFAIASLSADLLQQLPEATPLIVKAYLADSDIRRVSESFARGQRSQLVKYLRSLPSG